MHGILSAQLLLVSHWLLTIIGTIATMVSGDYDNVTRMVVETVTYVIMGNSCFFIWSEFTQVFHSLGSLHSLRSFIYSGLSFTQVFPPEALRLLGLSGVLYVTGVIFYGA